MLVQQILTVRRRLAIESPRERDSGEVQRIVCSRRPLLRQTAAYQHNVIILPRKTDRAAQSQLIQLAPGAALQRAKAEGLTPCRATSTLGFTDISLTAEQERLINEALRDGHYRNTTEVLDDALHALEEKRREETVSDADRQQAIERLRTFGKRHNLSLGPGLTVKDLISEGRR